MPTFGSLLVRRLVAQRLMALAVVVTLGFAVGVLVAGPIYADGAREAILSSAVGSAGVTVRNVRLAVYGDEGFPYPEADAQLTGVTGILPTARVVRQGRSTASILLGDARISAPLLFREGVEEHLSFAERPPVGPGQVAVHGPTAESLGIAIGDRITLAGAGGETRTLRVTGTYEVVDRTEPFWFGSASPLPAPDSVEPFPLLLDRTGYLALAERLRLTTEFVWDAYLDFAGVPFERAERLPGEVGAALEDLRGDPALARLQVTTGLDTLLDLVRSRVTNLRVPILLVVFQIGAVALAVLAGVGSLTLQRQAFELAVLRSRGFSRRALLLGQAIQAALIAAISFPVGLAIGLALARLATNANGPTLPGVLFPIRLSAGGVLAGAVGAVLGGAIVLLLSFPFVSRTVLEERRQRSREDRPLLARLPVEVVVAPLGLAAFWEVRRTGLLPTTRSGSLDPLVLLAPTLLLFAASFLALRLLLWVLRRLDRRIGRARALPAYLAGRRLGRSPGTSFATSLLLLLSVGLLVVSTSYRAVVQRNHADSARQQVGADWRVQVAATDQPVAVLGRLPAGTTGVVRGEPVFEEGSFRLPPIALAVDPSSYAEGGWWRSDFAAPSLEELLEGLDVPAPGMPLPAEGGSIEVSAEPGRGAAGMELVASVLGEDGTVARLSLGALEAGERSYAAELPAGAATLLSLVLVTPDGVEAPDQVDVAFGAGVAGSRPLALEGWAPVRWRGSDAALEQTGAGIAVRFRTGTSDVVGGLLPPAEPLPAIVSPGVAAQQNEDFVVTISGQRLEFRRVAVAEDFPTMTVGQDFVVTSSPALLVAAIRIPEPALTLSEVWATGADPRPALEELGLQPGRVERADRIVAVLAQLPQSLAVGMHATAAAGGLGLVVIGVAVGLYFSQRRREFEFAALRAMGTGGRQIRSVLSAEQGALVGFALLAGFGLGYAVLRLMMPYAGKSLGVGFPTPVLVIDWIALALSVAAIAAATAAGLALSARALLRASVTSVLRGEAE